MDTKLPKGFYFGAATSSHQVEGGTTNDWSAWEKQNAKRLAEAAQGRKWPDYILNPPAGGPSPLSEENYISGRATDHYHRYEEDFDLAKQLGHTAHRFSIEWSRIEPREGVFDEREIEHYRAVVRALRARGIEPFVTLWHWTLPQWLAARGGTSSPEFSNYFTRYAEKVVSSIPKVTFWIMLNEPEIYTSNSYLKGLWPPQRKSLFAAIRVYKNLIRAHRSAFEAIKKTRPGAQVGIAKHNIFFDAESGNPWNDLLKFSADKLWNYYFLDNIRDRQDFIGLNHYLHNRIRGWFNRNENKKVSEFLGWELYPHGIYHCIDELRRYGKPIYITENGLADARDQDREWYIREVLSQVAGAIEEGADVRGYFYWSFLDNFEWDKGFWPRFGLIEIDYRTLARTVRPSARAYAKMIRHHTL